MKSIAIVLLGLMTAASSAWAGAPGHEAYFCESASGLTKLTVIHRFDGTDGITIALGIRKFSSVYDKESLVCTEDECERIDVMYDGNGMTVSVMTAEAATLVIDLSYNGRGLIRKGFIHPETLQPFGSDIVLSCTMTSEQL